LLTRVVVKEEANGRLTETESELTWEDGRLVTVKRDTDGNESDSSYAYDDQGRLSTIETDGEDRDSTTTIVYDDANRITALEAETESDAGLTKTAIELDRSDEQINTLTLTQEGDDLLSLDILYDEETKRVDSTEADVETVINGEPKVVTGRGVYSYLDSGLVSLIENSAEVDNIEVDVSTIEVEYEDGDASSLDVTPGKVFFGIGFLFDMKGFPHSTLDNTTGVPRTAFDSW
jgi:YD repeat-containing protein